MEGHLLRGACSCGRNRYVVEIPDQSPPSQTLVFLDNSSVTRRTHASPLTAFLRVPLSFFHSSTHAFYPDEDHNSIRRTYTTPRSPETRKQFCGYCGTQLTSWSERRREDADFICLTLGSLFDEDIAALDTMGVLPSSNNDNDDDDDNDGDDINEDDIDGHGRLESGIELVGQRRSARNGAGGRQGAQLQRREHGTTASARHVWTRGTPWFEEMVEDSGLARVRRRHGGHISEDGTTRVEFEIVEIDHDSSADTNERVSGKRKYEGDAEGDAAMRDVSGKSSG